MASEDLNATAITVQPTVADDPTIAEPSNRQRSQDSDHCYSIPPPVSIVKYA